MAKIKPSQNTTPKPFRKYEDGNKKGEFAEPDHEIDPLKKDENWHRMVANSMFAKFIRQNPVLPWLGSSEISINRLYARGEQSVYKYKKILLTPETDENGNVVETSEGEALRKGYMNINWDIFSFMPKFKAVVMGMFEDVDYDAKASAIDEVSGAEREDEKYDLWFESEFKEFLGNTRSAIGVPQRNFEYLPRSKKELDLFENLGGIKLKSELGIERSLKYTFEISDWPEVKRKMVEDVFENNMCAAKDYFDPVSGKVKVRYVDIARLVSQYSTRRDYKNIDWAGELVPYTLGQLRNETDLTEEQLKAVGTQYIGYLDNPVDEDGYKKLYTKSYPDGLYHGLDDFKVEVFDAEFTTYNNKVREKRTNSSGEMVYNWNYADKNKKSKKSDKRESDVIRLKMIHKVKLIVGTDHIFDWGPANDIPRPSKKEANLSYHIYQLPGRSMTNICIPNIDQVQLSFLKLQNALAMSAPPGVSIEVGALQNMKLNGKKVEPLELMALRRQTGDVLWKATTHKGGLVGYQGIPVSEMKGGIGSFLDESLRIIDVNFQFIRDTTGISQFADATAPDPNQPVKTAMMTLQGTNNALKNIYVAVSTVKERAAVNSACRIQMKIKYSGQAYESYLPVLGKQNVQIFRLSPDYADVVYGISIELRPTEEMKRELKQAALAMAAPGQNGQPAITYSDYLLVAYYIDKGELRYAQALLSYKEEFNREEARKLQQENMRISGEENVKLQQEKEKAEKSKIEAETQSQIKIDNAKTQNLKQLETLKHTHRMEEILATPPKPVISGK